MDVSPGHVPALLLNGNIYLDLKDFDKAESVFMADPQRDSNNLQAQEKLDFLRLV